MSNAESAANWMADALRKDGTLYQDVAVTHLEAEFGLSVVTTNASGNLAVKRQVLDIFNKLTPDAVWIRSGRYWRAREEFDLPGRQQS
ncbi:hypothetical protein Rleg9DRAFT_1711 [Rhizobium leguminosarum bv. trifolii WSM597]|uniref:Uncharacterized protein n=1 Tax=Rhizobium leguminosarum bv. trifolii WSM597 TaxID=754764 RepID=I9N876_RHILT|nr:hypothetical protein [Rhizobium leguminosarum]EJB02897.1 hypothetical protein Rleg9DRAFT_1711 [Rhizobium leguminosarum bv. trifolii WSM597]